MRYITFLLGITSLTLVLIACDDSATASSATDDSKTTSVQSTKDTAAVSPSFDCEKAVAGSIEATICQKPELVQLDNQLAKVYQQALDNAGETTKELKAMQRGWIKGRNDCWKSDDQTDCIEDSYQYRIAELQARYQLVDSNGPFRFICDKDPKNEFIVTFYDTEPATLIAERGDQVSLMHHVISGSGAKYQGRNETFWEHHGEAMITWGYQAPELTCKKADTMD